MKAILLLFDSMKRDWLPNYGGNIHAPNFTRLAEHTVTFDNFYVGSLPCMPARRELHTGRYNFLHSGWSPLEPFDDSMPEQLKKAGVYTHLVSDHHHYWRDGGCNYHTRYSSYEHFRGQEGDPWIGEVGAKWENTCMSEDIPEMFRAMFVQDTVNRRNQPDFASHSQTQTFGAGLRFIEQNKQADNWLLQIECFDPHEPFFTYEEFQKMYPSQYTGRHVDWPQPATADQDEAYREYVQNQYKALVSMIDKNLGRLLDAMDKNDLWKDTMLVVTTDHGILLGEHDWWSKGAMPTYNEIANIPFFMWDPRSGAKGERRKALAQNIDVPATLLEYFGQPLPPDMEGRPLGETVRADVPVHPYILYGYHGGTTNITDGRYTYFRGPVSPQNSPLYEYRLMPMRMMGRQDVAELQDLQLAEPFAFSKGCRTMKIDMAAHTSPFGNMYRYGSRLYDLHNDPGQKHPLDDPQTELRLVQHMMEMMRQNDAPPEQFERLGLWEGITAEDLAAQRRAFENSQTMDVLPNLDWSMAAANQFKTLVALLGKPEIVPHFETYAKQNITGQIQPEDILRFAGAILEGKKAGMVLMMLKLNARTD